MRPGHFASLALKIVIVLFRIISNRRLDGQRARSAANGKIVNLDREIYRKRIQPAWEQLFMKFVSAETAVTFG